MMEVEEEVRMVNTMATQGLELGKPQNRPGDKKELTRVRHFGPRQRDWQVLLITLHLHFTEPSFQHFAGLLCESLSDTKN